MLLLVVEDDPVSARIVTKAAEVAGHACVHVSCVEDAWVALSASDEVDLVISAWSPNGSGVELCRRLRAASGRYRPFLFLTAADDLDEQRTGMMAGADDYLVKPLRPHAFELKLVAMARLTKLHRTLQAQAAELRKLNARFRREGMTDALTGLRNRKNFDHDLAAAHTRAVDLGLGYSLAMLDCDWFKSLNDRQGHITGDRVLQAVSRAMQAACRDTDHVYRYGGEEFAVILHTDDARAARRAVERMRHAVEALGVPHPTSVHGRVTISGGVVTVQSTTLWSSTEAVERADQALYAAKDSGRNAIESWEPAAL